MSKKILLTSTLLLAGIAFAAPANASIVAICDSGSDLEHVELAGRGWMNTAEIAGNRIDDDHNGKVDDINGWNFAEGYNRLFFREHLKEINPLTYQIFDVIARKQAKTSSSADEVFWKKNVTDLPVEQKTALLAHLNYYGQYAHGTHVAGIVARQAPNAKLLLARIFPDDLAPAYPVQPGPKVHSIIDYIYKLLAAASNGVFEQVASYLNENKVEVANYSVGISMKMLAENSLKIRGNKAPTADQISAEAQRLYIPFGEKGRAWMASSPGTLFVVAAGNDGADNDVLPTFPANVRIENEITVAASQGNESLADFSNYGKFSVDVAAPGVAIMSTVPSLDKKGHLPMSGTSMAAPYVTGVAGHIKDVNPALSPAMVREILMQTVDVKPWLVGKVISGGVVNSERAYVAAADMKTMDLNAAIAAAKQIVPDAASSTELVPAPLNFSSSDDMRVFADQLIF